MNRQEYNKAIDAHADGLYRFILKNMNDSQLAQDVVQEVFANLWEKHENVDFTKVKSYLFTAGYRTMLNIFRKNKKVAIFDEVSESKYAHSTQYSDLSEILDQAIKKLPDVQRSAVLLRDYEGYSYKEIGEILSLTEPQVKTYIFRARKFLQGYLKSIEAVL